MQYDQDTNTIYDDTIDSSKEKSLQKAISIFMTEQEKSRREIVRPDINPIHGIIKIAAVICSFCIVCFVLNIFHISPIYGLLLILFFVLIYAKRTILWMILLYQKFAPEHIRQSCVFEPSCSDYMILAINKYGLLKGMKKGAERLIRCHPPNGGRDDP